MQIQIFTIPVQDNSGQTEEMNKFLRSHTVIDVDKQLINNGMTSLWTFCVRYLEGFVPTVAQSTEKTDYKEILEPEIFSKYSVLSDCRKELADKNHVPVYVIFTNEELANMAKMEEMKVENVSKIKGIGIKKMEKYGNELIGMFNLKINETIS
jgi:superfamily II DNA helicase RecQ